jgi:hypothetical protein
MAISTIQRKRASDLSEIDAHSQLPSAGRTNTGSQKRRAQKIIETQAAIEAIDRAIADEQGEVGS